MARQRQASDRREVTDTAYVQNKLLEKSVEYLVMVKDEPKLGVIAQLECLSLTCKLGIYKAGQVLHFHQTAD